MGHYFSDQFVVLRILGCFRDTCCSFQTLQENEHYGCLARAAGVRRGLCLFFLLASLDLCGKAAANTQHPVWKASCLMELIDTPNLNSSLSPSAPEGSAPFQAGDIHPTTCQDADVAFQLHYPGKKMHAVPIIYWCRRESCPVP